MRVDCLAEPYRFHGENDAAAAADDDDDVCPQNYDGTNTPVWAEPGVSEAEKFAAVVSTIEDTAVQVIDTAEYDNITQYLLEKVGVTGRHDQHSVLAK